MVDKPGERYRGSPLEVCNPAVLRDGSAVVAARSRLATLEVEIAELIQRWEALETIAAEG